MIESPQTYQPPPEPSYVEKILNNILQTTVCVFLIVIFFFVLVVFTSQLNGTNYADYTDAFLPSNLGVNVNTFYTGMPHLTNIEVKRYNGSWYTVPVGDYTFDSVDASVTILAGALFPGDTSVQISGTNDYASAPYSNVLSAIAVSLIVGTIMMFFGFIYYKRRDSNIYRR